MFYQICGGHTPLCVLLISDRKLNSQSRVPRFDFQMGLEKTELPYTFATNYLAVIGACVSFLTLPAPSVSLSSGAACYFVSCEHFHPDHINRPLKQAFRTKYRISCLDFFLPLLMSKVFLVLSSLMN